MASYKLLEFITSDMYKYCFNILSMFRNIETNLLLSRHCCHIIHCYNFKGFVIYITGCLVVRLLGRALVWMITLFTLFLEVYIGISRFHNIDSIIIFFFFPYWWSIFLMSWYALALFQIKDYFTTSFLTNINMHKDYLARIFLLVFRVGLKDNAHIRFLKS